MKYEEFVKKQKIILDEAERFAHDYKLTDFINKMNELYELQYEYLESRKVGGKKCVEEEDSVDFAEEDIKEVKNA